MLSFGKVDGKVRKKEDLLERTLESEHGGTRLRGCWPARNIRRANDLTSPSFKFLIYK